MIEPREIGHWTKISTLGSGGFGTVELWRSSENDEEVAVKKCKILCVENLSEKQKERWCNEVEIMKELNHPNIVKYKQIPNFLQEELNKYNPSKLPILCMEYCRKGNLRHILTQPSNLTGLKEETVRNILLDICSGVSYLHDQNITHRDIKPENIVLDICPSRKDETMYKIIDLGYAKEIGDATVSFVGTLYYLAPEIFANQKYDSSVDYWSFGIVVFEIICGLLPFSSSLSPIDRYRILKNKGSDDICVYQNSSGTIQYSASLYRENKITYCLKNYMELWLRKVLQFNPALRSLPFPNSLNVFDQLNTILSKKILKVFIVYKYELYSYEYDEYTRLSTLRQWIERDTKIPEEDQLIFGNVAFDSSNNETLVVDCFSQDRRELYVFKRFSLFNKDSLHVPRLVKVMFERATKSFSWSEIKTMYAHAIHLISEDIIYASHFTEALDLYIDHIKFMVARLKEKGVEIRQCFYDLTVKLKQSNKSIKGRIGSKKNVDLYKKFLKLVSKIENCSKYEYHLAENIKKWSLKVDATRKIYCQVDIIQLPQLQELFDSAIQLLQKTAENASRNQSNLSAVEMLKIVCNVMKLKDKLLTDKKLAELVGYFDKANTYLQSLLVWTESFHSYVVELSQCFDGFLEEFVQELINSEDINSSCVMDAIIVKDSNLKDALIKRDFLVSRFQEVLDDSVVNFAKICDDIRSYLLESSLL